jgi:hypothetical protein
MPLRYAMPVFRDFGLITCFASLMICSLISSTHVYRGKLCCSLMTETHLSLSLKGCQKLMLRVHSGPRPYQQML